MSFRELEKHAQYDECPRFACDICALPESQEFTHGQLFEHIRSLCPSVQVQCQVCSKEFNRAEFATHLCLKDYYRQMLKKHQVAVFEYLAERMTMFRRLEKLIGVCKKSECLNKFRQSNREKDPGMIVARANDTAYKCFGCQSITKGQEEAYFCMYCNENYC